MSEQAPGGASPEENGPESSGTEGAQEEETSLRGKEARIEELLQRVAYLQADLENLQKRMERERTELVQTASEGLLRRLIPAVEEFELALESLSDRDDEWVGGLRMVYEKLASVLEAEGLQVLDPDGESFDPYLHEAVEEVAAAEEAGRVVEVRQKGYRLAHKVLRPAQVVVARKEGEENG